MRSSGPGLPSRMRSPAEVHRRRRPPARTRRMPCTRSDAHPARTLPSTRTSLCPPASRTGSPASPRHPARRRLRPVEGDDRHRAPTRWRCPPPERRIARTCEHGTRWQRPGRIRRHELHRVAVRVGDPSVDRREHAYRRLHHRNGFGPGDRAQQPPECQCDDQERGRDREELSRRRWSCSLVRADRSQRPVRRGWIEPLPDHRPQIGSDQSIGCLEAFAEVSHRHHPTDRGVVPLPGAGARRPPTSSSR